MDFVEVLGGGPGYTTVRGADGNVYTVRGTFSYRQNNPGNIRPGAFSRRHGAIGSSGGFAVFPSYDVGRAAKEALLFSSESYAGRTLRQAINKYAPPEDNNNTSAYVGAVARAVGIDPDTELSSLSPEQRTTMLDAMERVEGFRPGRATDEFGNPVDLASMPNPNIPTPEIRPETWTSAVPGAVERGLLDVPQDLQTPAVTPTEAYGLLSSSMGQTPSLNLSGAGMQSIAADRMAGGAVANGLDGLRSGLLASGSMPSREAQLAEMQTQANLQNEVNMARGRVSQDQPYQAYQPERQTTNGAVSAIDAVSPTTQQTTPSFADAYRQMGHSMEQGGILGLSGLKTRDPNDILGVGRLSPNPLANPVDNLPAYEPQTAEVGAIEGPVSTGSIQTPEAVVEQDAATTTTPEATQQQPSRLGRFAKNAGASLLGGIAGSAVGGPIGGMVGSLLAREALGANNPQGGMLGGIGGLLGDRSGQGAWAGVGTLNDLGRGAQAAYGAWGGPKGTSGVATDGSRITSLGNGLVSRIDKFGRETLFRDGQTVGGGGGWGNGGLLGGLFGGNTGDGSRSQADRARDSVGLY
ncbi:hypothetical protein [Shinella sp. JR1-6]|uniref:hypothetical protein n=1 Tax=Shinella sp. JR1-6 TaxID=2527671 RepID=UPI00102D3AF2|nr:hypothetical protein [Shinella sp. JR1-6]TAA51066.1 hypothetical protein EXZ48_32085 [Shinella sp. JR1-6]